MTINKEMIKKNGGRIIGTMQRMCRYSFEELQRYTRLGSTDLCLALLLLVQESRIEQNRDGAGVYYVLN